MPSPMIGQDRKYTYADYLTWPDGERWELIDGVPYLMSPAPSGAHQAALMEFAVRIDAYLKGKPCTVLPAPHDVKFEDGDDAGTVVQPDLTIWCKPKDNPDAKSELKVVIEILSPSTAMHDLTKKLMLYEKHAIPEYWIVAPDESAFSKYVLTGAKYVINGMKNGEFSSTLFPGLSLDIAEFFEAVKERGQYHP